jgi:hypothetical protein
LSHEGLACHSARTDWQSVLAELYGALIYVGEHFAVRAALSTGWEVRAAQEGQCCGFLHAAWLSACNGSVVRTQLCCWLGTPHSLWFLHAAWRFAGTVLFAEVNMWLHLVEHLANLWFPACRMAVCLRLSCADNVLGVW